MSKSILVNLLIRFKKRGCWLESASSHKGQEED
jgi:hypothetical protein